MIMVYSPLNTNFEENGDYPIEPYVAKLDSGEINEWATIELEIPLDDLGVWENIVDDCIISCPTPWNEKELFRVWSKEKNTTEGYLLVEAHQLIRDSIDTIAKDLTNSDVTIVATGQTNGQGAITKLLSGTKFTGHSNISTMDSVRWDKKSITEALLSDDENSFVTRWGGELHCANFDIYMNSKIGINNGVRIAYGKNLKSMKEKIDMYPLVTRIIPEGANGLRLTGLTPWVDSVNINKYANIHEKSVKFDIKVKENEADTEGFATEEEAREELIRLSNLMFTDQHVDTPTINIKTSMVDIRNTTEYKGYEGLENINKGDTIICQHAIYGVDTVARCISYTWNILTNEMIDIQIGDVTENYFNQQSDMAIKVANLFNPNGSVNSNNLEGIINALQVKFRALKNIAQTQHVRAILFEDLDSNSPTFGAMCIGTMGFEIASTRNAENTDWDFRTFGTGKGFDAGEINVGILSAILIQSLDGKVKMDLSQSGKVEINGGALVVKNNNAEVVIDGQYNMHKILVTGTVFITIPANVTSYIWTLAHGLTYKPCSNVYIDADGAGFTVPLPYFRLATVSEDAFGMAFVSRFGCDTTNLRISFDRKRPYLVEETLLFRYYIYKEVAI